MSVTAYSPLNPQLNLLSSQLTQQITNSVSPLHRDLSITDILPIYLDNQLVANGVKPEVANTLWRVLLNICKDIAYAANHYLPDDSDRSSLNIHPLLYQQLGLQPPRLVSMPSIRADINPLQFPFPIDDLQHIYSDLQLAGREAVDWIVTARIRGARLGIQCSWMWGTVENYGPAFAFNGIHWETHARGGHPENEIILHPTISRYARTHQNFDAYARTPLINNGFVDTVEDNTERRMILHPVHSRAARTIRGDTPYPSRTTETNRSNDINAYVTLMLLSWFMTLKHCKKRSDRAGGGLYNEADDGGLQTLGSDVKEEDEDMDMEPMADVYNMEEDEYITTV